jgi:pyruvate/2-oxoglutarate dehydrogenase complex dihydrolipoamide acyltransferase (E2) component
MDVGSSAAAIATAAAAAVAAAPEQERQKVLDQWTADFQPLWRSAAAAQQQGAQHLWQVCYNRHLSKYRDMDSSCIPSSLLFQQDQSLETCRCSSWGRSAMHTCTVVRHTALSTSFLLVLHTICHGSGLDVYNSQHLSLTCLVYLQLLQAMLGGFGALQSVTPAPAGAAGRSGPRSATPAANPLAGRRAAASAAPAAAQPLARQLTAAVQAGAQQHSNAAAPQAVMEQQAGRKRPHAAAAATDSEVRGKWRSYVWLSWRISTAIECAGMHTNGWRRICCRT